MTNLNSTYNNINCNIPQANDLFTSWLISLPHPNNKIKEDILRILIQQKMDFVNDQRDQSSLPNNLKRSMGSLLDE